MTLDSAGLEAAAKALGEFYGGRMAEDAHGAEAAVRAYLAAVVPVTPTTENPYRGQPLYLEKCVVWDEGWAAGRAAATPDPPDMTNMCEGESPDHKPGITPAASPDERLREAARVLVERSAAAVCQPGQFRDNVGEAQWRLSDAITATRAALAADREAPDEEEVR